MRINTLFQELHRRHVYKAGVAYLVVAWLIVQVLSIMADAFELADDLLPYSILLIVLCFPVWLAISWFYDLTEDGIVRTRNLEEGEEAVSTKSVNLNKVIITSLSITVILLIMNTFRMKAENKRLGLTGDITQSEAFVIPEFKNSVGILPFKDLSPGENDDYFAIGITDEIRNRLDQIQDLKVIFSPIEYHGLDHRSIAKALEVDHILEGSIRVTEDMVRITARIIDGSDGSDRWSHSFEPKMEDILYTEAEIAKHVSEILNVTLSVDDVKLRKIDPEAYVYYSKANQALSDYSKSSTGEADSLINLSLQIDDSYAPAWVTLSRVVFKKTYHYYLLEPAIGYERGTQAAKRAIDLDEGNALAYAWLSHYEWQNSEAVLAENHLEYALHLSPNDPAILFQAAKFMLNTNRLQKAKESLDKTILLDPANLSALYYRAFLNWTTGDLKGAEQDFLLAYRLGLVNYFKNYEMALLQRDMGNYEEALQWAGNEENWYLCELLHCSINYAMGNKMESFELLNALKSYSIEELLQSYIDAEEEHYYELASLCAYMGDRDNALNYLDKAFEHLVIWPDRLFTNPDFNDLKKDERWDKLLLRLGVKLGYDFFQE